jgi:hypothetical protein
MKRVVVPMDGSARAIETLRSVVCEGPGSIERIEVVNVQPLLDGYASRWLSKAAREAWRAERAREALAPALAVLAGTTIPWRVHTFAGRADSLILAAARRFDADEIAGGLPRRPIARFAVPAGLGIAALVWLATD